MRNSVRLMLLNGVALVLAGSAGIASAESPETLQKFQYRVRIPATAQSCEQEAAVLGEKFARATSIQPEQSLCREVLNVTFDKKVYKLYSLVVTYSAEQALSPYSARFATGGRTWTPEDLGGGIHDTFEDCVKDLDQKRSAFEVQTGLSAVSAFCEVARYGRQFFLQIDGFGTPAKRLYGFTPTYMGSPEIMKHVSPMLAELGVELIGKHDTSWLYFASQPVYLQTTDFGGFSSADECKLQLQDAVDIYRNSGSRVYQAECASGNRLQAIGEGISSFMTDYGTSSSNYYSLAECLNDKPFVLEERRGTEKHLLGGICRSEISSGNIFRLEGYHSYQ